VGWGRGVPPYHPGDGVMVRLRGVPAPRDWLHRRQIVRPLLGLFVPPFAMASM
jgi:hypothetical protein